MAEGETGKIVDLGARIGRRMRGELGAVAGPIEEVRRMLGLRSRLQLAVVCTAGVLATTASLAVVLPLLFAVGLGWVVWELARRLVGRDP